MAQIKTPYGLVYNTDGTLCTTYRDDDIPFPGVRSFAVEEATTNLITNMDLTTWTNHGFDPTYKRLTGEYFMGQPVAEFGKPGEDRSSTGDVDRYLTQTFLNLTQGDLYTFSIYVYVIEAGYGSTQADINGIWIWRTSSNYVRFIDLPKNKWVRVEVTGTINTNLKATPRIDIDNSYVRLACPQFEKKPFASSFVDGNRMNGNISLPFIEKDDFVISFWFKPDWEWGSIPTPMSTEKTYNVLTWGNPGANGFLFRIVQASKISIESYTPTVGIAYDVAHFNGFVNFVIKKLNKTITVYANAEEIMEITNTNLIEPTENVLWFGSRRTSTGHGRANGLFSNIFLGKYRKPNGEIIWTDDYIREVYEAQIPFPVQSQLSIY